MYSHSVRIDRKQERKMAVTFSIKEIEEGVKIYYCNDPLPVAYMRVREIGEDTIEIDHFPIGKEQRLYFTHLINIIRRIYWGYTIYMARDVIEQLDYYFISVIKTFYDDILVKADD